MMSPCYTKVSFFQNYLFLFVFTAVILGCSKSHAPKIDYDTSLPEVVFAVGDIESALASKALDNISVQLKLEEGCCDAQGFSIKKTGENAFLITSGDARGLMYGGLEFAELVKTESNLNAIKDVAHSPYIANRGIKYNIPLDVRTSSFDDSGDAAQSNIINMWDLSFWTEFFDDMARHRYNMISFWNAHPFSSMVKLEDYPDVALQDVCGTTIQPQEHPYYWNVPELASSKIVANLKVIKKMSIDEKIIFWQKVMEHAKNRGIDVYFITWNICLNGAAPPGPNKEVGDKKGKYGITNDFKNPVSIDYLRKSVKQFLLTYPNVKGIGVTAGENMRTPMTDDDKEKWLWKTYGLGIMDAKAEQPDRTVNFIHRFWWTDYKYVEKYWGDYPDPFDMSFKYAKAHMYSAVNPPFYKSFSEWMKTHNLKSWWNLRNDDIFIHRWGNPEYVSAFIKNLPYDQTAGYHMGSDGYVWGREFTSKTPKTPRELEINKHWYRFMLWGRLGYDPNMSNERFIKIIAAKFPETNPHLLFQTWAVASNIIPQVTRFAWGDWDYHWQPEACMETWNDLKPIDKFTTNPTMEGSGILNVADYVKAKLNNEPIKENTPLQVIDNLKAFAAMARDNGNTLLRNATSEELVQTLLDIKSMSYLGDYYANKFSAAVELEFFKNTGESEYKEKAISYLEKAVLDWTEYRDINAERYLPQNFARLRTFDFNKQLEWVKKDIEIAKAIKPYE